MSSISKNQNFKTRLNYLLFDRFDASEKEMRKFHFGTQMGFLGGMFLFLFDAIISQCCYFGIFGINGELFTGIVLITNLSFLLKKLNTWYLVKELGLLAHCILFHLSYGRYY